MRNAVTLCMELRKSTAMASCCVLSVLAVAVISSHRVHSLSVVESRPREDTQPPEPRIIEFVHDLAFAPPGITDSCEFDVDNDTDFDVTLTPFAGTNFITFESDQITIPAGQSAKISCEYRCPEEFQGAYRQIARFKSSHPEHDYVDLVIVGTVL